MNDIDIIRADRREVARILTELGYDGETLMMYVEQYELGEGIPGADPRTPEEQKAIDAYFAHQSKAGSSRTEKKLTAARDNLAKRPPDKRGGRPKGSTNKPKIEPTDPG